MYEQAALDIKAFVSLCRDLCARAGEQMLRYWKASPAVEYKLDNSPVTEADRASHNILATGLTARYPHLPLISEEGLAVSHKERRYWKSFFLVDPLDGTKDFLDGRDEFAICIGLIEDSRPIYGVLYAPARRSLYYGGPGHGAFKESGGGSPQPIQTAKDHPKGGPVVLHSRSHRTPKLDAWLKGSPHERKPVGSGLKFALLAEGQAQLYPCLHPTYEWDTAAGQAIVEAAGGTVLDLEGRPLLYNKEGLLNPSFVARA